jgi:hypothetical protein
MERARKAGCRSQRPRHASGPGEAQFELFTGKRYRTFPSGTPFDRRPEEILP